MAVLLLALLLAGCGGRADRNAGDSPWHELPTGWSHLPSPPGPRSSQSVVWTGRELITWGGASDYGETPHDEGAAYDPSTREWRVLPRGPLSARASAAAVWTGDEMLVWGGWTGDGDDPALGDGAAYDPEARSWRTLPDSPLSRRVPVAAIWTGVEMIAWGDVNRFDARVDGAAYDPEADRWRALPPAPMALNEASGVWTGRELVVVGALLDGNNWSKRKHAQGIAYDPEANSWRVIAPSSFSPQATWAAWTGEDAMVWDYELDAGAYDPDTDSWRELPDLPLRFSECYPKSVAVGAAVFAWHCGGPAALLDIAAGTWTVVSPPKGERLGSPTAAGDVVVFESPKDVPATRIWAFKP